MINDSPHSLMRKQIISEFESLYGLPAYWSDEVKAQVAQRLSELNSISIAELRRWFLLENFGLPQHLFNHYRLNNFVVVTGTEEAFRLVCQFLCITRDLKAPSEIYEREEDIQEWLDKQPLLHNFITFVGPCGRGKTHLALAIGIWCIEKFEMSAIYYQVPDLLSKLRQSYEKDAESTYSQIIDKCREVELLILDDLGMQQSTAWAIEQLDSLIDYRYIQRSDTVFTTNLTADELPPRISSRIKEGEIVQLTGCDYRELIAGQRLGQRIRK